MKWAEICAIGRALPEVEEAIWYRTPSLAVRGRSFVRLKEDGASVVFLVDTADEQAFLIERRPKIYFITDHYRGRGAVLAHLATLSVAECRARIETAWRIRAPRALVKAFSEGQAAKTRAASPKVTKR